MKLKFKHQQFQTDAVNAVADLFVGQASSVGTFNVNALDFVDMAKSDLLGYCNSLSITAETLCANLHKVQERNLLPLTEPEQLRFNVEMETGTGKTFVNANLVHSLKTI